MTVNSIQFNSIETSDILKLNGWPVKKIYFASKEYYSAIHIIQAIYRRRLEDRRLTRQEASQILHTLSRHHKLLPQEHTILLRIPQHLEKSTYITKDGILAMFESRRYPLKRGKFYQTHITYKTTIYLVQDIVTCSGKTRYLSRDLHTPLHNHLLLAP